MDVLTGAAAAGTNEVALEIRLVEEHAAAPGDGGVVGGADGGNDEVGVYDVLSAVFERVCQEESHFVLPGIVLGQQEIDI